MNPGDKVRFTGIGHDERIDYLEWLDAYVNQIATVEYAGDGYTFITFSDGTRWLAYPDEITLVKD